MYRTLLATIAVAFFALGALTAHVGLVTHVEPGMDQGSVMQWLAIVFMAFGGTALIAAIIRPKG